MAPQRPPLYWMHETSGTLAPAVEAYVSGDRLSPEQLGLVRAYLWQWVNSPAWLDDEGGLLRALRLRVARAKTQENIDECVHDALDLGLDPL